jgi:hypothetical protein
MKPNDPLRDNLERVLQSTRRSRNETQAAQICQPMEYNLQLRRPSFGAPTVLNTHIAAAAFQHNQNKNQFSVAPFALHPIQNVAPSRVLLGANFKRNKFCWRCGYQRKLHNDYGLPFGHGCRTNCGREDCSKCGERVEFHADGLASMGPSCSKQSKQNSPYYEWYSKSNTSI